MKPKGTSRCSGRKVVVSSSSSSTMVTACWQWTCVSRRRWRRRCGSQGGGVVPFLIGQDILLFSSADHSLKKDGIFLPSAIYQSLKRFSKCFSQYWQCEGKFSSLMGQDILFCPNLAFYGIGTVLLFLRHFFPFLIYVTPCF